MPKTQTKYVCQDCGTEHLRWAGRCNECGAWNSLEEVQGVSPAGKSTAARGTTATALAEITSEPTNRQTTGSAEFDRVLGGGLVAGSLVLLGGEPGLGKSTLLLQISGQLAEQQSVLYISGEESLAQIGLRAERLGVAAEQLKLATTTSVDTAVQTILAEQPAVVIVDSIQTLATEQFSSGAGSVTQVRESAARLQTVAKTHGITIIVVGHVTKEGALAGPKVLEHLVDVVLYLEGERYHGYRLLRGAKNRFGPTDEVGVYTMEENGLQDVTNPAGIFIDPNTTSVPGTVVTASLEGTRALLVEVQALAVETVFGYPKRTANGYDLNKLQLLTAVLTKHAGVPLASNDLFANVSGGYKLREPATDLAVALAIVSAAKNTPVAEGTVVIGEVGLSGEVRPVPGLAKRLEEAARGGFNRVIIPTQAQPKSPPSKLRITPVASVTEAIKAALQPASTKRTQREAVHGRA